MFSDVGGLKPLNRYGRQKRESNPDAEEQGAGEQERGNMDRL